MSSIDAVNEKHVPTVGKETKVASEDLSDLESDTVSTATRAGSIYTIIGSVLANLSDGYQNNLTRISNAPLVGAVTGILVLGYTSDKFSRKGGMFINSGLVVIGSLATLVFQVKDSHNKVWFLTIARGIVGVGVGGEYPTSAAAALEGSNEHFDKQRGPIQVLISTLMATSGGPICTFGYLASLIASSNNLKTAYHARYGISIFIPLLVITFRLKMQDGRLFRKRNFKKGHIPWKLVVKKYWLRLLGTSSAFFLYGFVNFPNLIMSSAIIHSIVPDHNVRTVALWQLTLAPFPVPGVLLGAWLVNKIGRKWTGIAGFVGYIALGFINGGCYTSLTTKSILAFVVLYGLLQCLGHMGPGATIGLIGSESYPTAVRGMEYGISTTFGKAGAAVGTQVFTPIENAAGKSASFYLVGGIGVLGTVIYYFLPEGRVVDLKVMDEEFEDIF